MEAEEAVGAAGEEDSEPVRRLVPTMLQTNPSWKVVVASVIAMMVATIKTHHLRRISTPPKVNSERVSIKTFLVTTEYSVTSVLNGSLTL